MPATPMRRTLATAAVAAAISAGAVALPTFAQSGSSGSSTGTSTNGTTTTAPSMPGPMGHGGWGDRQAAQTEYETALAKELGIPLSKLQAAEKAARQTVFLAHLDDAVTAGAITKAEAQTLRDAATKGTLTQAVKDLRLSHMKAALAKAVSSGQMTQSQADQMLSQMKQHMANDNDLDLGGPGMGGPGMMGGPDGDHHWGHGGPPSSNGSGSNGSGSSAIPNTGSSGNG